MKLEKWVQIAEIAGAAAIVVSLVFVGFQIRASTEATYAATYDQLLADQIDINLAEATNPDFSLAYHHFANSELLDATEDVTFQRGRAIWLALGRQYERAYFAHEHGRLRDSEWGRFQTQMCGETFQAELHKLDPPGEYVVFAREFWEYLQDCEPDFQL